MKVGVGLPVTKKGFHRCDTHINSTPITLIDSWGLETGNSAEWKNILEVELSERSLKTPLESWFHTVIYCIGAGSARVEKFEIDTMKMLIENGYHVIVVLNKADQVSKNDLQKLQYTVLKSSISEKSVTFVNTCCEEKVTIVGQKIRKIGIEDLKKEICSNFWSAIIGRLPQRSIELAHEYIDQWILEQHYKARRKVGIWGAKKFIDNLKDEKLEKFIEELSKDMAVVIQEEMVRTIKMFDSSSAISVKVGEENLSFCNMELPELKQALRIGLGCIAHMLPLLVVPLLLTKKLAQMNVREYITELSYKLKEEVNNQESIIKEEIERTIRNLWEIDNKPKFKKIGYFIIQYFNLYRLTSGIISCLF